MRHQPWKILGLFVLFALLSTHCATAGSWALLGTKTVKIVGERDVIVVTGAEGTFSKIKLLVKRRGIHIGKIVVHYGNGTSAKVAVRKFIPAGGETRAIDLPGNKRTIKKVVFHYKTKRGAKRRAIVELFGKH